MMPHDWSIGAWAEQQPVTVTNKSGRETGSFFNAGPHLARKLQFEKDEFAEREIISLQDLNEEEFSKLVTSMTVIAELLPL